MNQMNNQANPTTLARRLAPEDITPGIYVAVLHKVQEVFPRLYGECAPGADRFELSRVVTTPTRSPTPLRVIDVCVPFVFVERPNGRPAIVDLRRARLARLGDAFGALAFDRFQAEEAKRRAKRRAERDAEGEAQPPAESDQD